MPNGVPRILEVGHLSSAPRDSLYDIAFDVTCGCFYIYFGNEETRVGGSFCTHPVIFGKVPF